MMRFVITSYSIHYTKLYEPGGIEEWLDIGPLSALERQELDNMLPSLRDDIALGEQFALQH